MKDFFTSNRERLTVKLRGGIIVMTAYTSMQRGNDIAFAFEQESNFWWLTDIEHADWWMIIDGTRHKTWLVAPKISEVHEIFEGSLAPENAKKISGADEVITQDEAMNMLRTLAKRHSVVYTLGDHPYVDHFDFSLNPAPKKLYNLLNRTFNSVQDCRKDLAELRALKQPYEITCMKKVIQLTTDAFSTVKKKLSEYEYEYEIEAEFGYQFRRRGSHHAYDPIVAVGSNASVLHYVKNDARLKRRELLMMDIGARMHGYAADVSRTYAIGEPTKRQRLIHGAIQEVHARIIDMLEPNLSVEQYVRSSNDMMGEVLVGLELISDPHDLQAIYKYFPNAISHGLGVDVHDSLGSPRIFQPGMVLTVEPGVYIPKEGIGVRIEDDILITENGHINLSGHLSTDL